MGKNIFLITAELLLGIALSFFLILYTPLFHAISSPAAQPTPHNSMESGNKQVIGFLPYWLLSKAHKDYSPYITTLTYFALRINKDGSIVKRTTPTQEEPGWYALVSGKADSLLTQAKAQQLSLSLAIDTGDIAAIDALMASPSASAQTLIAQVQPVLDEYGFSDVNLDIEYTKKASDQERKNFITFVQDIRNLLPKTTTLTIEVSPVDTIEQQLIDIPRIAPYANNIVLMAYDYHATDSLVTGPVAPLSGAGIESEFDVTTAIDMLLQHLPAQKIILGVPLYGYEWETLGTVARSAVIPGSGVLASNNRVENFLPSCSTCTVREDTDAKESYVSFFSNDTNTTHIIFSPDIHAMRAKIGFANEKQLGGLALWALGYEGNTILTPLTSYKK